MSHSLFPSFAQKLEQLFDVTCRKQDARILNAIIHIWRSICVDAELCQQLLKRGTCFPLNASQHRLAMSTDLS